MERGGPSWAGWHFGPWGRARDWRLHAPDGTSYCAEEIAELRRMALDLDYLQVRVKELEANAAKTPLLLSEMEILTLQAAAAILMRLQKVRVRAPL